MTKIQSQGRRDPEYHLEIDGISLNFGKRSEGKRYFNFPITITVNTIVLKLRTNLLTNKVYHPIINSI